MAAQPRVQLDLPLSNAKFYTLPKHLPGRVNVDDFVFFVYPASMNPGDYMVVLTSLDTSNHHLKTIGNLKQSVELPHVQLDAYGTIFVMPVDNKNLPTFFARLNRGSTYNIPDVRAMHRPGMKHAMNRSGILVAGSDASKNAY